MKIFALLLTLLLSTAHAALVLKPKYHFSAREIYSSELIDSPIPRFVVLEIAKDTHTYKIKSSELIKRFADQGIAIESESQIIEFVRLVRGDFHELSEHVGARFVQHYAPNHILVKNVEITPMNSGDRSDFKLKKIDFDDRLLRRSSGSFSAHFENSAGVRKKLFFRFEIDASLEAIFTKETLKGGDVINHGNVEIRRIPFPRLSAPLMERAQVGEVSVKSYVSQNTVLTKDKLIPKIVIKRGDKVHVRLIEGGVSLEFSALAQQDGALGSKIRVKNERNKKSYDARVVDSALVVIE